MLRQALLFAHLAGVIVWVGGMAFAYFCLRPAAAEVLQPPQRLPLWQATFRRFFRIVAIAVAFVVASGLAMFFQLGFALAPAGWHIMLTLGLVMTAVFVYIYAVLYPALVRQCAAAAWPAAGAALNRIRQLVALNLVLSVAVLAAALSSR
jgi:uncharacterized membrane protein